MQTSCTNKNQSKKRFLKKCLTQSSLQWGWGKSRFCCTQPWDYNYFLKLHVSTKLSNYKIKLFYEDCWNKSILELLANKGTTILLSELELQNYRNYSLLACFSLFNYLRWCFLNFLNLWKFLETLFTSNAISYFWREI